MAWLAIPAVFGGERHGGNGLVQAARAWHAAGCAGLVGLALRGVGVLALRAGRAQGALLLAGGLAWRAAAWSRAAS